MGSMACMSILTGKVMVVAQVDKQGHLEVVMGGGCPFVYTLPTTCCMK